MARRTRAAANPRVQEAVVALATAKERSNNRLAGKQVQVTRGYEAPAGKSILELMWEELDALMEILMAPGDFELEEELGWYKGRANGLATCIALVHNPYVPDVVSVRQLAKERYEQMLAGEKVVPLVTRP